MPANGREEMAMLQRGERAPLGGEGAAAAMIEDG